MISATVAAAAIAAACITHQPGAQPAQGQECRTESAAVETPSASQVIAGAAGLVLLAAFRRRRTELRRLPVPAGRDRPSRWQLRVR